MKVKITTGYIIFFLITLTEANCPNGISLPSVADSSGNCYVLHDSATNWTNANAVCEDTYNGYALAQTRNSQQIDVIDSLLGSARTVWIGGAEYYTGWTWQSENTSLTSQSYSKWSATSGHETYYPGVTCGVLRASTAYEWRTSRCTTSFYFICEVDNANSFCSTDLSADRVHVQVQDRCFLIMNTSKAWFDARDACVIMGGDLAAIDSSDIQSAIESVIPVHAYHSYWISLRQSQFYWSTGELIEANFWEIAQPNFGDGLACMALVRELQDVDGATEYVSEWRLRSCSEALSFICQIGSDTQVRDEIATILPPTTTTVPSTTTTITTTTPTTPGGEPGDNRVDDGGKEDDTAVMAGLIVTIVIVFAILFGLIILFFYYTRRNKRLKKKMRNAAQEEGEGTNYTNMTEEQDGASSQLSRQGSSSSATNYAVFTTSNTSSQRNIKYDRPSKYSSSENIENVNGVSNERQSEQRVSRRYAKNDQSAMSQKPSREHRSKHGGHLTRSREGSRRSNHENNENANTSLSARDIDSETVNSKSTPAEDNHIRRGSLPPLAPSAIRSSKHRVKKQKDGENDAEIEEAKFKRQTSGRRGSRGSNRSALDNEDKEIHNETHKEERKRTKKSEDNNETNKEDNAREDRGRERASRKTDKHPSVESENTAEEKSHHRKHKREKHERENSAIDSENPHKRQSSVRRSKKNKVPKEVGFEIDTTLKEGIDISYLYREPSPDSGQSEQHSSGSRNRKTATGSKRSKARKPTSGDDATDSSTPKGTPHDPIDKQGLYVHVENETENTEQDVTQSDMTENTQEERTRHKRRKDYDQTIALETIRTHDFLDDTMDTLDRSLGDAPSLPDESMA